MWSIRRRLSYANVLATLALVFAMSGAAVAANHFLISSTKQISPKVLKQLKGRTGARGLTGRTGSGGPAGLRGEAGARGETGLRGVTGPTGATGETGPPGEARAFAVIVPTGVVGHKALIEPGSRGVAEALTASTEATCVYLESSIEVSKATVAVVTADVNEDVNFASAPGDCIAVGGKVGIQVNGFNADNSANITTPFEIVVQ